MADYKQIQAFPDYQYPSIKFNALIGYLKMIVIFAS